MSGVDQIMRLADEWYAHGQTSHSGIDEKYAALRAAVEQIVRKYENVYSNMESARVERDALLERAERAEQVAAEWTDRALNYHAEKERAEQEAAANKKDADRYRWLRGGADVPSHSVRWGRWEINHWEGANGWRNLLCSELDAAIDAAMQEGK